MVPIIKAIFTHIHIYLYTYLPIYIFTYVHIYLYKYLHIYVFTYIHLGKYGSDNLRVCVCAFTPVEKLLS
jgi:hypothetical protein